VTEFVAEYRHYCRNPKCRTKLSTPVSNPREAFCPDTTCRERFYRLRCYVCEEKKPGRLDAHTCGRRKCKNAIRSLKRPEDTSRVEIGLGNAIKSGLPEADKYGRAWKVVSGEISPNAFHCATLPDGPNCQWKGGEFERVEAKNRAAFKAAAEATIEANGYFTDPDWREVVSPDGVKGFVTSFGAPARRARALPHPLTADLSIPEFIRRASQCAQNYAGPPTEKGPSETILAQKRK
jgi:hypothetical protein